MQKIELCCEICQAKFNANYNTPKVLTCGHTVCSKCVDRMREKNINKCPFDRKVLDFEDDKIAINYYILSLIDNTVEKNLIPLPEEDEEFSLNPKPVVNSPGWKNTLDGFIKGNIMYTVETNGFIYSTDLNTGEWWFMYHNQFFGNYLFQIKDNMYLIDQYGSLFQIFNKNYYVQIGKKNIWKNTTHLTVFNNKVFTIESSNKLFETTLKNGKYKEIVITKDNINLNPTANFFVNSKNKNNSNLNQNSLNKNPLDNSQENKENIPINNLNSSNNINIKRVKFLDKLNKNPSLNIVEKAEINSLNHGNSHSNSSSTLINVANVQTNFENSGCSGSTRINSNLKYLSSDDYESKIFKNINMLFSTKKLIFFSNKSGELFSYNDKNKEIKLVKNNFYKNIESYSANSTHVYFFEKNSKIIYRMDISFSDKDDPFIFQKNNSNIKIEINDENKKKNIPKKVINKKNSENLNNNLINSRLNQIHENLEKLELSPNRNAEYNTNSKVYKYNNVYNNLDDEIYKENYDNYEFVDSDLDSEDEGNELYIDIKNKYFLQVETFINLETINKELTPIKIITSNTNVVIIDKLGEIYNIDIQNKSNKCFQCLFMLRNCHLSNSSIIGDGDLLLLDPIRLSLNKLNILAGTEVIVLHSSKFLYTIKNIFSANSRIYFIDVSGNLYYFNEIDKKLTQIGNNGICKYILDLAVHKNYLLTIENNTLYRTSLSDGNYTEIKNEYVKNYEYFFADNTNIIFISKDDEIQILNFYSPNINQINSNTSTKNVINNIAKLDIGNDSNNPNNKNSQNVSNSLISGSLSHPVSSSNLVGKINGNVNQLYLKSSFKYDSITRMHSITYFRNNIIFYNIKTYSIESINIEDKTHKVMVENFPEISQFINNNDFLACILKNGVIYKLYC